MSLHSTIGCMNYPRTDETSMALLIFSSTAFGVGLEHKNIRDLPNLS